jgi:hypothetical protein
VVAAKRKPPDLIENDIRTLKRCNKALEIPSNCQLFTASNPSSRVTAITRKAHMSSKTIKWSVGTALAQQTANTRY